MVKRHATTILIIVLFVLGVCVLLYPTASNWLEERNASYAIEQYAEAAAELNEEHRQEQLRRARAYNDELVGFGIRDPFNPEEEFELPPDYAAILNVNGMMGYLEIPKIDVYLPIQHGTSEATLRHNVGHMQATAFPIGGASTHAVLTGHRGLPQAKLFTDLDRLEPGDTFFVHVLGEIYAYEVDQILVVEPHETDELMPVAGEDLVTLITCTPYGINSHRMFVRGHRVPYTPTLYEQASRTTAASSWLWYLLAGLLGGLVLLAIYVTILLGGRKRRARRRRRLYRRE